MKRILAALLLLTLAAPAWGQDFEKGMQAYWRDAYPDLLQLSTKDLEAQRSLRQSTYKASRSAASESALSGLWRWRSLTATARRW